MCIRDRYRLYVTYPNSPILIHFFKNVQSIYQELTKREIGSLEIRTEQSIQHTSHTKSAHLRMRKVRKIKETLLFAIINMASLRSTANQQMVVR